MTVRRIAEPPTAPLSFEQRRWTAVFTLPFAAVLLLSGLISLTWLPAWLGPRLGWPAAALGLLTCGCVGLSIGSSAWRALRSRGPALIVDDRGITDRFHLNTFIPWSAVQSATIDRGHGYHLILVLRPGASLPDGGRVQPTFWRQVRRLFSGGDVQIPLGGLVYNPNRLRAALQSHLADQRSRRTASAPERPRS